MPLRWLMKEELEADNFRWQLYLAPVSRELEE
jgi:hypothetical protein